MMTQLGQVMLYVQDVESAKVFWTKQVGFELLHEAAEGEVISYEVAPTKGAQTALVLFDRNIIAKFEPELDLAIPSLLFFTEDADDLYQTFMDAGITLGEKVQRNGQTVFNFSDQEGNYFAVMEQKGKGK